MSLTVSVVIPARGRPGLVRRAVDGALDQTVRPLEIILVDDGSEPSLADALDLSAVTNLKVLRYSPGVNASYARNRGIEHASGDVIAFLDSDDWWGPTHLESVVQLLEQSGAAGLIGTFRSYYGPGTIQTQVGPGEPPPGPAGMLEYLFEKGGSTCMPAMAVRKNWLGPVRFDESLAKHQDWDFAVSLARQGRIVYNPNDDVYVDHTASQRIASRANPDATLRFLAKHASYMTTAARNGFLLWTATSATLREDARAVKLILSRMASPKSFSQRVKATGLQVIVRIPGLSGLIAGGYKLLLRVSRRRST